MNEQAPKTWADVQRGPATTAVDLAVIGGGLTGLALAVAVAGAGLRVVLIERRALEPMTAPAFDGRVTAVAPAARRLLEVTGVWGHVTSAEPILDIRVMEGFSSLAVHYACDAIGADALGHIVENGLLREALLARALELPGLVLAAPAAIASIERGSGGATVLLDDGRRLSAPLVAACDGKRSGLRKDAGIRALSFAYGQTGIVCTLAHERSHRGLAIERFFPDGPFAMLPMTGRRTSIVWALEQELARAVTALPDDAFLAELGERFGDERGALRLEGPRFAYPLELVSSQSYVAERLALVGDAARAIHPIAGQGWNLALRDVGALAEIVVDAARLGLDPGGRQALARYARWRRFDSLALIAVTDGINRLFANDVLPIRLVRELGLGLVDRLPPLKRLFMRHAMGELGDLPRPLRGLAL